MSDEEGSDFFDFHFEFRFRHHCPFEWDKLGYLFRSINEAQFARFSPVFFIKFELVWNPGSKETLLNKSDC